MFRRLEEMKPMTYYPTEITQLEQGNRFKINGSDESFELPVLRDS